MGHLPYLDDYLLRLQTDNYSDETVYNYERDLKTFEAFLSDYSLHFKDITKRTIDEYKAYLVSRDRQTTEHKKTSFKLQPSSVNRILSSLRSYIKYCVEMDYTVPIPSEAIRLVKTIKKHPHIAELNELIKVIEAPTHLESNSLISLRNRAMLEILFSTGMRISELLSLNRIQIDNTGRIFIRGKGKKERFVYLTPRAHDYLKLYTSIRVDSDPALFTPLRGKNAANKLKRRISANYLQYRIKYYRKTLQINIPISAHSLRHGFATYLAESGANPAAIQILLGHESLTTTTRYVHASDQYAERTHRSFHPLKKK